MARPAPTDVQIVELLAIDDPLERARVGNERYGKACAHHIDRYLGGGYLPPRSFHIPPQPNHGR